VEQKRNSVKGLFMKIFSFILDLIILFPLAGAFYLLWQHRKEFKSIIPFLVGVILSFIARFCDLLIVHPDFHISKILGVSKEFSSLFINTIGGFADVFAVLFLVVGFLQTIQYQQKRENRIRKLETLLPVCAGCKKYRVGDGTWHPIEKYLMESGAPDLTHSICPDCAAKLREEMKNLKKQ
jgi:hypothetical protein